MEISRKIVVVLRPPAIEPGLPPVIISRMETNVEKGEKEACGIVSNPAVRKVVD